MPLPRIGETVRNAAYSLRIFLPTGVALDAKSVPRKSIAMATNAYIGLAVSSGKPPTTMPW